MTKRPVKNQSEIVRDFAKKVNINIYESEILVANFLELILGTVINGHDINFNGFGKFYQQHKKSKTVYHPQTREKSIMPEYDIIQFRPSKVVKDRMNWKQDGEE